MTEMSYLLACLLLTGARYVAATTLIRAGVNSAGSSRRANLTQARLHLHMLDYSVYRVHVKHTLLVFQLNPQLK